MLNGNKLVFILPLILMGFIFYGGYSYLNESEYVTNEELQETSVMEVSIGKMDQGYEITGSWNWNEVPVEGFLGEDYIGITLMDQLNEPFLLEEGEIIENELSLIHSGQEVWTTKGKWVETGMIFSFPNELKDHESLGDQGQLKLVISSEEIEEPQVSMSYLHTWVEHQGLLLEEPRFLTPTFNGDQGKVPYWVIERIDHLQ
ncbi:hypothetical protein [Desertibacillus haloalkaliphilus]|uniref:hypothetical protein n=1 Tax=Desertibacillus haloalkaliphilus TaxID=1328930 RepID=UPI001C26D83C|nr:hypothetical protein [Desertibacillus haloalkaliphilus]MBU8905746.1 hypothetical protein [Desertibacillus haloalkaliphilus]